MQDRKMQDWKMKDKKYRGLKRTDKIKTCNILCKLK